MRIPTQKLLFLLPLVTLACAQAPKKQYQWNSLGDQGQIQTTVTVMKESKEFKDDHGFDKLEVVKARQATKPETLQKIIFIGDTGCRLKEASYGDSYQDCKNPKDWAYPAVMEKIAAEKPDLIVHVGDYHYREQCSEGKPCRKMTDMVGYGWRSWEADFFQPSVPGFKAAPWILVRGNHEDCKRAFEGYKLISTEIWTANCVDHEKTQYIQIGDLLFVNLDTASVSDRPQDKKEESEYWDAQLKDIEKALEKTNAKYVWLITHKPVAGLALDDKDQLVATNPNLQKALLKTHLDKKIQLMIAGHIHNTQFLQAEGFPRQLVVGNGGSSMDDIKAFNDPKTNIIGKKFGDLKVKDFASDTTSDHAFGFATLIRATDSGWVITLHDQQGQKTKSFPVEPVAPTKPAKKAKKKK